MNKIINKAVSIFIIFSLVLGLNVMNSLIVANAEEYVIDMVESYGYAMLNSGQAETALFFENIYEEFGDSADFKFLMGLIYMNNEMFDEAVGEFLKATEYEESRKAGANSYLAFFNAGVIFECCGMLGEARELYTKCGDYEPAIARLQNLG